MTVNCLSAVGFDTFGLLAVGVNAVRSVTVGRPQEASRQSAWRTAVRVQLVTVR